MLLVVVHVPARARWGPVVKKYDQQAICNEGRCKLLRDKSDANALERR